MTAYIYYTASTMDGFLADANDSLDWLLTQPIDDDGPFSIDEVMSSTGAIVMGRTTYQWVVDHIAESGEPWPYADYPTFLFTHRGVDVVDPSIETLSGKPSEHRARLEAAAGEKNIWVVGGGDLAAQFAESAMLDELVVSYAPATVGSGRPLFTRAFDFELLETGHNRAFLIGRYRVVGPR
ncbi:dihydrofolate reductase family protein [Gordonia sp. HY285]|uniref:dihydrofolate reductase family protein n=1 Tax=Gordonia liuliyuniae TaxID=2911517 RepID=UPI001F283BEA|nr:dihydrofolate reductase family protein [Gordonia liuliyuniae]MCF8608868.1 dihydrofolate reductase family protein [Gordonia liuliyuniae]